ncbi:ketoacyl-synt-domain-containing protein [Aspergillus karnatakaensis]|uniref:type I polyketide synthase n=1 Tax=Aspergillus karnatakaensis TaxID=1810916 RepID=UPI003CCCD7CD
MAAEPIAIIGTGCKFPGSSTSPSRLWDLLSAPKDVASKPPANRFNIDGFYHPNPTNPLTLNVKESYFLNEDVRPFDASFFSIAANESTSLDPQQRMLLETVYESLEAAGLRMEALRGSATGVFCGVMCADWEALMALDKVVPEYAISGVARNNLANRISYFFDWTGPSMSIDTACSSSLVALHQGISALQRGECSLVAAVGTNLILGPTLYFAASNLQMLSPESRGRMWDHKANGYVRGEGLASVILKRLSDAVADGDPIECVIRASGVNQDARTLGLTMPSGKAQERLIRSTYALAGLDVNRPEDRPQYFEAHGTIAGTQAGDFQEASGIHNAFFGEGSTSATTDPMYVGSIKTVLGHSEGCAGLAGIVKASLCIQNGKIPPNLHFEKLNPKLEPYSGNLKVPIELQSWPKLPPGVPRRVSVNSFGFGGTNSHAILESYEPNLHRARKLVANGDHKSNGINGTNGSNGVPKHAIVLPFAFSAASERTLGAVLTQYDTYLKENCNLNAIDLSWSLMQKRSALKYRVPLYASTISDLQTKITEEIALRKSNNASTVVSRSDTERKKIMGIFTGQGAQWPEMGLDLITTFPAAKEWFQDLQKSLDTLPLEYRPKFSLLGELAKPKGASRVQEAAIAQPLCTAVQIVLVNVLWALGVQFDTVVGHSSGEVAAAYAAGVLNAHDAIRIAYLRGKVAHLAGSNNQRGGMLAAGLSFEEATTFSCNSPSSVTLSGDADSIREAEQLLKSQDKFARVVLVDTAYHSHHMEPCADPYLAAMGKLWYSTVHGGKKLNSASHGNVLTGEYWKDNMRQPVLFYQALMAALADSPPGLIIEVGPHPALKGPVMQGISEGLKTAVTIPYVGTLRRGSMGIEAIAETVGSLWTYLGSDAVDIARYISLSDTGRKLKFVDNLPYYPFDHSVSYWTETRRSKAYLHREPRNELLGDLSEETAEGEWRWRNFLIRSNMEYLDGHQIQNQTIFPATGYIAMALEAAGKFATSQGKSMRLVQVHDLLINQAIAFPEESKGIETLFRLYQISAEGDSTTATFNCHVDIGGTLKSCASGQLVVTWGEMDAHALPPKTLSASGMSIVDIEEFYTSLGKLGYGYTDLFRGLTSLKRKFDASSGILNNVRDEALLLHPATMDCGLQCLLGAVGAPGDGELSRLQIPTKIQTATINPMFCERLGVSAGGSLSFDAAVTTSGPEGVSGDVSLFTLNGHGVVQFEGVQVSPLERPTPRDDRPMFSEIAWGNLQPDAEPSDTPPLQFWSGKMDDPQHMCFLVMKELLSQLTPQDRDRLEGHRKDIVAWFDHVVGLTREGQYPLCKKEWADEDPREMLTILAKTAQPIIVEMTDKIREYFPGFLRNEISMIEIYRQDNLLTRFYDQEQELKYMSLRVGDLAGQISFRYPRMKILEIGAGTASATRAVLGKIGQYFHSYTFTDISAAFFEDAEVTFAEYSDRMIYKVLDIEKDPLEQGFEGGAYDLVIAANVLHATKYLEPTMTHARRLLKPGGHLIALEITNEHILQDALLFSPFEGWWLGKNDNRPWGPKISVRKWEHLLRQTGFSGVDTIIPAPEREQYSFWGYSTFVTQAVEDRMERLRKPLALPSPTSVVSGSESSEKYESLMIIGGATEATSRLIPSLQKLLGTFFHTIVHTSTIEALNSHSAHCQESTAAILCLADMDTPCFQGLNETKLRALKRLLATGRRLLWVTAGSESQNPYLSMSKGFLSCIGYEYKGSLHQYLNVVEPKDATAELLATTLMRMVHSECTNDYSHSTAVDSVELELRFENGTMKIPRIMNATSLNQRYAATKRAATEQMNLENSSALLKWSENRAELVEGSGDIPSHPNTIQIRVRRSLSTALKIKDVGSLALIIGTDEESKNPVVAFAEKFGSRVSVPSAWCSELPEGILEDDEVAYLRSLASAVIARNIVQQAPSNTALLVHGADDSLRQAVWYQAVGKGVQPYFSTIDASAVKHSNGNTLFIHERSTTQALARVLPKNISVAASFSKTCRGVFESIEKLLPKSVNIEESDSLLQRSPSLLQGLQVNAVAEMFNVARVVATQVLTQCNNAQQKAKVIGIEQFLARGSAKNSDIEILNWTGSPEVPVRISSASSQVTLRSNRTYLLVGMSGDLGQSVCHWMITKGARNLVLASRTPKVDSNWIEEMARLGARVRVESMDVTNLESILTVDRTIRSTLPPVGGVVNGAMVLRDQMFSDVQLENILETYKPKIEGSQHLEQIYGHEDLDFFILFGSATSILGNIGQSSYGAATNYMRSLIRRRREQNLVGSIIHPAEVRGVGYISRMGSELSRRMASLVGSHIVSERDLHETFAEAILAGNPALGRNPEVISGFTQHDPEEHPDIIWYSHPKTWPLVNYRLQSSASQSENTSMPIKKQLEAVSGMDEAAEVVLAALTAKIIQKLHLDENVAVTADSRLTELGADSLVAVDLRTWFLKELEVEIPVLQIQSGASIGDLAASATAKLPVTLIPNVQK